MSGDTATAITDSMAVAQLTVQPLPAARQFAKRDYVWYQDLQNNNWSAGVLQYDTNDNLRGTLVNLLQSFIAIREQIYLASHATTSAFTTDGQGGRAYQPLSVAPKDTWMPFANVLVTLGQTGNLSSNLPGLPFYQQARHLSEIGPPEQQAFGARLMYTGGDNISSMSAKQRVAVNGWHVNGFCAALLSCNANNVIGPGVVETGFGAPGTGGSAAITQLQTALKSNWLPYGGQMYQQPVTLNVLSASTGNITGGIPAYTTQQRDHVDTGPLFIETAALPVVGWPNVLPPSANKQLFQRAKWFAYPTSNWSHTSMGINNTAAASVIARNPTLSFPSMDAETGACSYVAGRAGNAITQDTWFLAYDYWKIIPLRWVCDVFAQLGAMFGCRIYIQAALNQIGAPGTAPSGAVSASSIPNMVISDGTGNAYAGTNPDGYAVANNGLTASSGGLANALAFTDASSPNSMLCPFMITDIGLSAGLGAITNICTKISQTRLYIRTMVPTTILASRLKASRFVRYLDYFISAFINLNTPAANSTDGTSQALQIPATVRATRIFSWLFAGAACCPSSISPLKSPFCSEPSTCTAGTGWGKQITLTCGAATISQYNTQYAFEYLQFFQFSNYFAAGGDDLMASSVQDVQYSFLKGGMPLMLDLEATALPPGAFDANQMVWNANLYSPTSVTDCYFVVEQRKAIWLQANSVITSIF